MANHNKSLFFIVCLLLCLNSYLTAQTDNTLRKHVIIAIDQYPGVQNDPIRNALSDARIMVPQIINVLDSLISDSDYVSIVNYSIGTGDRSWDKYTTNTWSWSKYDVFRLSLQGLWEEISVNHKNEGKPFSLLSGGKYYSFHSLLNLNKEAYSNKVYLIDISDEYYNASDNYKKEFQEFQKNGGIHFDYNEFKNTIIKINQQYHFEYQKEIPIKRDENIVKNAEVEYKFILFEVTPNQTTLNSVLNYPAYLGILRVRGGYRIEFDYNNVSAYSHNHRSGYKLHRLDISPLKKSGEPIKTATFTKDECHVSIHIDGGDVSGDTLQVEMRGWLEPKDEIYSGLIMNPYDKDFKNLNVHLSLPLDTGPRIFGIIPLYDFIWWWFPDDILYAVYTWDIVLGLIIIVLMIYAQRTLSKKMGLYIPTNSVISMDVKSSRNESPAFIIDTGNTNRPKRKKTKNN